MAKSSSVTILNKSLVLLLLVAVVRNNTEAAKCGETIVGPQGELNIPANVDICKFLTPAETKDLILDTDGLSLAAGDKLTITSNDKSFDYTPPTDAGFLHIGGAYVQPSLQFIFNRTSHPEMVIKYSLSQSLPINADTNHNFKIINVGLSPALELKFSKTLNETIHIELAPSQDLLSSESVLGNYLMAYNETSLTVFVDAKNAELFHVRTTIVDKSCSNTFNPLAAAKEISGPQVVSKPYKCVNIFKFGKDSSPEAHFDVDFANFLSLAADSDELIIKDSGRRLFIDRTSENDYRGSKISTEGLELIIIYNSPDVSKTNVGLGLRLTIVPERYGGVVSVKKELVLPSSSRTTYTLIPDHSKCVSLRPLNAQSLGDANLTISSGGSTGSKFGPNTLLPPIMGTSEPSKKLVVSYSGKTELKLQFSPDASCCNQVSSDPSGYFSVNGGQNETCYWTLATGGDVAISFDENDLSPDGCVTIQSLDAKVPLYSRCNIKPFEVIPKFVVSQAYVSLTLPKKDTKFTAFLAAAPAKMALYEDGSAASNLTTPGYPVSYPVLKGGKEVYSLNATKKNYLVNVIDLDLRTGEKLQIGKDEINNQNLAIIGDLLIYNATVNITLTRPVLQTDFSSRRGLKLAAISLSEIRVLSGNVTANNSVVLSNPSNSLVKISSPLSSSKQPQPRVNYNITSNKGLPDGIELKLYDGPSVSSPVSTLLTGSTTSGSLMLIARTTKPNVVIPPLTIDYWFSACNSTDDLVCDNSTRCVPRSFQCKGKFYCKDGSDMRQICNSTGPLPPQPAPNTQSGVGGFTVFILCVFMLTLGVLLSTYGPGIYKTLEDRFRGPGQYNSFTSVE